MNLNRDEFKILRQENKDILSVVNRIDRDFEEAIKDSQELTLRVRTLEEQIRQLKEMITKMPLRVEDKINDAMQPATDLKEAIDAKKNLKIEIQRRWWEFWK